MTRQHGEDVRSLYEQNVPPPERCDHSEGQQRCINVGKFRLVTDGGNYERFSCRTHLAAMVDAMGRFYECPVMVDVFGRTRTEDST